jgi:magnesium-transporting ATPase (P-type)
MNKKFLHFYFHDFRTLTQNIMTFKKFSGPDGNLKGAEELANEQWTPLMAAMTLCHSVVVTLDGKFAASSPGTIRL